MHSIQITDVDFHDLYHDCADTCRKEFKENLEEKWPLISEAMDIYRLKMPLGDQVNIIRLSSSDLYPLTQDKLGSLYPNKMLGGVARGVYDNILSNSSGDTCCFCSYEDTFEIDHFLPKQKFPEFAIFPDNLLPVCHRCNKAKDDHTPTNLTEAFIHPYFENITETTNWLSAKVVFSSNSPTVIFFVSPQIPEPMGSRLKFQFEKLNLGIRYSLQAGREISSRFPRWLKMALEQGTEALKRDLADESDSLASWHKNNWKAVFYECVQADSEFLEMDWEL